MTALWEAIVPPARRVASPGADYISGKPARLIASLRIEADQDNDICLFRCDDAGEVVADTLHETINEAMTQAQAEFDIRRADWIAVEGLP